VNTVLPDVGGAGSTAPIHPGDAVWANPGTWTGTTPMTFLYQLQRCNAAGASCVNTSGNVSFQQFGVGDTDVGSTLRVVVTATNAAGTATATSPPSVVVQAWPPHSNTPPVISGTPAQGQTLTTSNGTWDQSQPTSFVYQWQRCSSGGSSCVPIAGATTTSYALLAADVGSTMRVAVTGTNTAGSATGTSAATTVIVPPVAGANPPPVTAGLQLWYDASQEAYADGAAVTRWTDRSGLARDLTAFDSSAAATFRRNAVNGLQAIEFNGSTSLLKTYGSTFTIAQPDTFFLVYRSLDTGPANIFDSMNSSLRQSFGRGSTAVQDMYADIDLTAADTFPFPGYEVWSGVFNSFASSLSRNGITVATGRAGSASMSGFTLGALNSSGQYGYSFSHSLVADFLVY
jgi:hypothetical protein